jgi:hypothetical protein
MVIYQFIALLANTIEVCMKVLLLAGNWVEDIRPSGYAAKLHSELGKYFTDIELKNGGTKDELDAYLSGGKLDNVDVVLWFVNVPNSYPKSVDDVKKNYFDLLLVTSKNNLDNRYTYMEIVSRMLKVKANLGVVFTKVGDKVAATVMDPLGNAYCLDEKDIAVVAKSLATRINELAAFTRKSSVEVGNFQPVIPDEPEFFEIARQHAETFHILIHPVNTERFLGNLSFRCENGFPSFRRDDFIYVTRRNIDKRQIGQDGVVRVFGSRDGNAIYYNGSHKPSVDAPVLVDLYNFFRDVRYTIHSHVYVKNAPFTMKKIPCGAMEEFNEILNAGIGGPDAVDFAVNLLGHGSIVFAKDLAYLQTIKYYARPIPEM